MNDETPDETAHALLASLRYLIHEAQNTGFECVAIILSWAAADVIQRIDRNDNAGRVGDRNYEYHLSRSNGLRPPRAKRSH